jgi:hypothetical protein
VLVLVACGNPKDANKSNFGKAIQAWLDTQEGLCLHIPIPLGEDELPFSLRNKDVINPANPQKQEADALVNVGLLSKRDVEVNALFGSKKVPGTEYQATDLGKQFLKSEQYGHRFCTGQYKLVEIDNFTEPGQMMGIGMISKANFRYKVENAADWAHAKEIRAIYEHFEKVEGDIQGKATLVLTSDGWMHDQLFRNAGR